MTPFLFFIILATVLIVVEVAIFQLSVLWLLFIGLGALVSAIVAYLSPQTSWLLSSGIFLVASLIISILAYRPLKKWQDQPKVLAGNDAIGQSVKVIDTVAEGRPGKVIWSGTEWEAYLASGQTEICAGETAKICSLEGIRLTIQR